MLIIVFMILNYEYSNNYRGCIATCSNKKMPEIIPLSYKITRLDRGIQENVVAMKLLFSCLIISERSLINRCNV